MKVARPLSRRLSWALESREVLETGLRDWSHSLFKRYNATLVNSHFIPVQISSTLISLMEAVLLHCDGKGSPWWILQVDSGKVVHFQTWSAASHLSCIILVPFLFMIHYDQGPERRNWEIEPHLLHLSLMQKRNVESFWTLWFYHLRAECWYSAEIILRCGGM